LNHLGGQIGPSALSYQKVTGGKLLQEGKPDHFIGYTYVALNTFNTFNTVEKSCEKTEA
jgi:hypothetical protein